jgi:hypothetical protein
VCATPAIVIVWGSPNIWFDLLRANGREWPASF